MLYRIGISPLAQCGVTAGDNPRGPRNQLSARAVAAFPGTIRAEPNREPVLETLIEANQAVVVCGILEDAQGRIFLARREADQALAGYWEFPGGKAEAGESLEAALCREFREELAMELRVGEEIGRTPVPGNGGLVLVALRAWTDDERPVLAVHDRWRWVSPLEAQGLELAPADIPLLEAFIAARSA